MARLGILRAMYMLGSRDVLDECLSYLSNEDESTRHNVTNGLPLWALNHDDAVRARDALLIHIPSEPNLGGVGDAERVVAEIEVAFHLESG